jgi:hypothetical protein
LDLELTKIATGVVLAVVGWVVGHRFNARRDAEASRRELINGYLVAAYRKLNYFACVVASGSHGSPAMAADLTSAIGDVQLFGTLRQIKLARGFAEQLLAKNLPAPMLTDLLQDLRRTLRSELHLEATEAPIAHLLVGYSESGAGQTKHGGAGGRESDTPPVGPEPDAGEVGNASAETT